MTESRYKIEYVQPEPVKEKNFRFLGVLGYLWLALLASVFTYGFVYKHITTNEIIAYFQNFKTEVANTNIVALTEEITPKEINITPSDEVYDPKGESTNSAENPTVTANIEDTNNSQKLVSTVIEDEVTKVNQSNDLPEDVVFESVKVEPTINQEQLLDTESIINEINKAQNKQTPSSSTDSAIAAIESEIKDAETTVQEENSTPQIITKEAIIEKTANTASRKKAENKTDESFSENSTIPKSQEIQIDAITAAIKEQQQAKNTVQTTNEVIVKKDVPTTEEDIAKQESLTKNEEKGTAEVKNIINEDELTNTIKTEITSTGNISSDKTLEQKVITSKTITSKEPVTDLITEKKSTKDALSELVQTTTTTVPNKTDQAYLNAVSEYEKNKIANKDYIEIVQTQEKIAVEDNADNNDKEPENNSTSAVDAIIAAMNADKAAKEKRILSSQEKTQSEVNALLKKGERIQSASQSKVQAN